VEGHEFYKVAAKNSKDTGAKKMFESLAKDEREHYEMLAKHQEHLVETGTHKPLKKPAKAKLQFKSPVFTKAFLSSKRKKNFEMSALSIGVMLEMNAIEFFREQQVKSSDTKAKQFYQFLIDWEGEHLRALIAQRNFLMRGIFEDARFEPF
jgi:rubrerythrin